MQNKIRVHPGEAVLVKYYAHNRGVETATGNAVPSVSPGKAAVYVKRVQCFCFTRQELKTGESREMPVQFLVEYDLPKKVKTLTLSYAFFNADKTQAKTNKDEESNASSLFVLPWYRCITCSAMSPASMARPASPMRKRWKPVVSIPAVG